VCDIGQGSDVDIDGPGAYAICDILRAAKTMIIVVGPPYAFATRSQGHNDQKERFAELRNEWLESWGQRLWTLPELLLCPNQDGIPVHTLDAHPREIVSKYTIARMLKDGTKVRELLEHYAGTIQLSPLELTVIATQCLFARSYNIFSRGDASYALMGLMRRRPKVNQQDSAFKAFARLSLLNDNDRLLERLICLKPDPTEHRPWYDMYDAYSASLWDVEPCTQVAGIVDAQPGKNLVTWASDDVKTNQDETQIIVLDGAVGATIKWNSLEPVPFSKRSTGSEQIAGILLRSFPVWFLFGLGFTIVGGILINLEGPCKSYSRRTHDCASRETSLSEPAGRVLLVFGIVKLSVCALVWALLPAACRRSYAGKLWSTQAALFGISGIPDLEIVERCLFGFNQDRITWSTYNSTGIMENTPGITSGLQSPRPDDHNASTSRTKIFTLIDTFALTATAFEAERPPVAAIVCGQEAGMQRVVLCSYDPETRAFCKETVLRMTTLCLERMRRIDRFRFAMRRG